MANVRFSTSPHPGHYPVCFSKQTINRQSWWRPDHYCFPFHRSVQILIFSWSMSQNKHVLQLTGGFLLVGESFLTQRASRNRGSIREWQSGRHICLLCIMVIWKRSAFGVIVFPLWAACQTDQQPPPEMEPGHCQWRRHREAGNSEGDSLSCLQVYLRHILEVAGSTPSGWGDVSWLF